MTILKTFLLILFFWLQCSLWIGKNGVLDYIKIYKKITIQKKKNEDFEMRNNQLILEIERLNNSMKH